MGGELFGIGFGELVFLVILALVIFGPKRIPEIARTIGRFMRQVRQATSGIEDEVRQLMDGQGDPATWLGAKPPDQAAPHATPRAMPFTPFVPPQGLGGKAPSALPAPTPPQEEGQSGEVAPPGPALTPEQGESEQDPRPPSSIPG